MPAALASVSGWAAGAEDPVGCAGTGGQLHAGPAGLRWSFRSASACGPALTARTCPTRCPRWCPAGSPAASGLPTLGLDGRQLTVAPAALAAAVPGAPADGVVVDRTLALRAADFPRQPRRRAGVDRAGRARRGAGQAGRGRRGDHGVATAAQAEAVLMRQGPALASVLFLAAAVAAALLAAGAAVLGLYQAGRRRRHEYAALIAGRVPRRSLRASVLIEQAVVLGFGAVTGIAAGIASAAAGAAGRAGVPLPAGGAAAAVRPVGPPVLVPLVVPWC